MIELFTPLTKADVLDLSIGDTVYLSGTIYTARDAAHQRIRASLENGESPPVNFAGQIIFYAGPCPAKPGSPVGSIAPTTSARMDAYVEMTFKMGALGMIGKGERSDFVSKLHKKYAGIYFLGIGGASAITSKHVKACETVAYEDLGTESIKKLTVEKLRLIVGIDTNGRVFQTEEIKKYAGHLF